VRSCCHRLVVATWTRSGREGGWVAVGQLRAPAPGWLALGMLPQRAQEPRSARWGAGCSRSTPAGFRAHAGCVEWRGRLPGFGSWSKQQHRRRAGVSLLPQDRGSLRLDWRRPALPVQLEGGLIWRQGRRAACRRPSPAPCTTPGTDLALDARGGQHLARGLAADQLTDHHSIGVHAGTIVHAAPLGLQGAQPCGTGGDCCTRRQQLGRFAAHASAGVSNARVTLPARAAVGVLIALVRAAHLNARGVEHERVHKSDGAWGDRFAAGHERLRLLVYRDGLGDRRAHQEGQQGRDHRHSHLSASRAGHRELLCAEGTCQAAIGCLSRQ